MKKGFKLFDYSKPGKGVKKVETDYSFFGFFKLFKRKFFDLSKVNFLWVLLNFPLFFGFLGLSGNFNVDFYSPASPLSPIVNGVGLFTNGAEIEALRGVVGKDVVMSYPGETAKLFFWLTALVVLTLGFANTGMAYVLRNHSREEYVDMPGDFFRTIKKNFGQALLLGIIDVVLSGAIIFAMVFYSTNSGVNTLFSMSYFFSFFVLAIWVIMHFYMYQLLVTFKLSTYKILKNSFIFAMVGIKRNIVALIGIIVTILLNIMIYIYFLPLGGLLPFFITIALISFIGTFAAYPNIKKIMIDPYYKSSDYVKETPDEPSLFKDRG